MMASGIADNSAVVANDAIGDGQQDDSKLDKKKKKGTFQKIRNFFGGSSKKRFKPEGSLKSQSFGALNQKQTEGDDDDDGGFIRQKGLGSRSISEDSVFKQEPKESPIPMLQGHAVSMEHINKFHSQVLSKPNQASSNQDSDLSLGLDGTSDEEYSKVKKMSSSLPSVVDVHVEDFEVVQRNRNTSLSNEAAKHRISVKPKSRRLSTKMSMKKRDKSPAPMSLADVQEESPSKAAPTESSVTASVPHKTVISTTIPVGSYVEPAYNAIPKLEIQDLMSRSMFVTPTESSLPRDIPRSKEVDDLERSRPRSMSPILPLSTSPISIAMLQEVKLRAAKPGLEKSAVENAQNDQRENEELTKAFSRAKRISKKFDEGGFLDVEAQKTEEKLHDIKPAEKVKEVKLDIQTSTVKSVASTSSNDNQKDERLSSDTTNIAPTSPTAVSYVLKKEPLRNGSRNGSSSQNVGKGTGDPVKVETASAVSVTTISLTADDKTSKPGIAPQETTNVNTSTSVTVNVKTVTLPSNGNNKLASPREEYRLKRQARSKTLPASKNLMDKKETDSDIVGSNRKSADLENIVIPATDPITSREHDYANIKSVGREDLSYYENIGNVKKDTENPKNGTNRTSDYENFDLNKRSSWASSSSTTGSASSQPEWVTRALKIDRKKPEDIVEQPRPKEIKIDPVKSEDKKDSPKSPEVQTVTEKTGSNKPDGVLKQDSVEKQGSLSLGRTPFGKSMGSPTKTFTASAANEAPQPAAFGIGKPPVGSSSRFVNPAPSKPVTTEAPKPATEAPKPSTEAPKPTTEAPKPVVFPQRKTSIGSSAKPFQTEKPTFQSVKPPTAMATKPSVPAEKPVVSAAKPSVSASPATASKLSLFPKMSDKRDAGTNPVNSAKSNVAKTDVKDANATTEKKNVLTSQSSFEKKNVLTPQTTNISNNNALGNKIGSLYKEKGMNNTENNASSIVRKVGGSVKKTTDMKIEIIDKDAQQTTAKLEQISANVPVKDKPKATVEKCSDGAGNRPKVSDMVKSFQKLQVT
ncbi:nucleolar and coiled-body phosphoprotein 1-like [Dreissena polymorpha]|uniref:nucleolar and coiled-body phosphoprotein 1-like n=1 Tax=Dreissena polymorpha TaxID=45954 RepID=UPI002263F7D1|nr:nucleolar and coiled-body phosphoprotein 1-like [Dreissena polymorpha]XP_052279331.1 nucleolar and coiled-body phosphoprotein 1-like [Dreissena polymorpha]